MAVGQRILIWFAWFLGVPVAIAAVIFLANKLYDWFDKHTRIEPNVAVAGVCFIILWAMVVTVIVWGTI